jgi:hypothetical protein
MSKNQQALEVLIRAQEQLIGEIATCGQAGGVGRAQNYAPVLVNINQALVIVKALAEPESVTPEVAAVHDRMAAVRAAKQNKQSV